MSLAPRRSGFRELYDEHYAFVWHTVRRFGVPAMLAEDAVQDTFVTAFRRRHDFDGRCARAWLYSIGRRVASNHRRGRARAERRHQLANEASASPRAAEDLIVAKTLVDTFLGTLSRADQELFVLSEVEGLTGPELAKLSGRKLPTLYSRIRVVRRRFEAFVSERGESSTDALQRARQARPTASAAGWIALFPRLGLAASTGQGVAGASASWLGAHGVSYAIGSSLAIGALVCIRMIVGDPAGPAPRRAAVSSATAPSVAPAPAPASRSPELESESESEHATLVSRTEALERPPRRTRPPRARPPQVSSPPISTDLAADLELLRAADDSLRGGDPTRALTQLEDHADRFSHSSQADLRAALRVEALCALGRGADARATARALLAARPTTPVARRIRMSCATPP